MKCRHLIIVALNLTLFFQLSSPTISLSNGAVRVSNCSHRYTPDQLVKLFEPEVVSCYGYVYEESDDVLRTMCYGWELTSPEVTVKNYEVLAESVCPLFRSRSSCLWSFINSHCTREEFEIISRFRRTSLIVLAKELLCNGPFKQEIYKFLRGGGRQCLCNEEFRLRLLSCIDPFFSHFPLASIPFETLENFFERAPTCASSLFEPYCTAKSMGIDNSAAANGTIVKSSFRGLVQALKEAQDSLWSYRNGSFEEAGVPT